MINDEAEQHPFAANELAADDQLLAPPQSPPPPLIDPRPALLNTDQLAWPEFERLIVAVARDVDGLRHVSRWGGPGQAQQGLDVVGQAPCGEWVGYQAKQVRAFDEKALAGAVRRFATDRRPLGIRRLVVCTSVEANRQQVRETLAELMREYPDLELELYDQAELSEKLRDRPDIVRRFFGDATAERFCAAPSGDSPVPEIIALDCVGRADALMRGPLEAIGLAADVTAAQQVENQDPSASAAAYREAAVALESHGYRGHALLMQQQAATALIAASAVDDAASLLIDLIERAVIAGTTDEASPSVHRLRELMRGDRLSSPVIARAKAALALHDAFQHPFDDLADLTGAVDELAAARDGSLSTYVLALGEAAIASDQPAAILDRIDVFARAAAESGISSVGVRIRLALAEATGQWQELVALARRRQFPPPLTALVQARFARYLTLAGDPDEAATSWWDAINSGALAGLGPDTAAWLYAVRANALRYGPINKDFETHHLAQAMRSSGGERLLPAPRDHYADALAALHDGKLPGATQAARRAVRDAVTAAHFQTERAAVDLLADIYAAAGEYERAAVLYVRVGQSDALSKLLGSLGDSYVDLSGYLSRPAPWQRASAYKALAVQADLVPDNDVAALTEAALNAFRSYLDGGTREGPFAPHVGLTALDAIAALIERATEDQARTLTELLAPLVPREANHFRHTDEAHVRALAGVLDGHPTVAPDAADQLLDLVALDHHVSEKVVDLAGDAISRQPHLFVPRLELLSATGRAAARLLTRLDKPLPDPAAARSAFEQLTASYEQPPGVVAGVMGLAARAMLVRHLPQADRDSVARALLTRAQDRNEIASNRWEALAALRTLADVVSADLRSELFLAAMKFAQGDEDGSALDDELAGPAHPLSLVRISFGGRSLAVPGLLLSAVTCTDEQAKQVEAVAASMLGSSDDQVVHGAALAMSWLPDHGAAIPPDALAGHPSRSVRSLAAVRWARQPEPDVDLGLRLARDNDALVRRSIAAAVVGPSGERSSVSVVREELARDPRYSVRRIVRRPPAVADSA